MSCLLKERRGRGAGLVIYAHLGEKVWSQDGHEIEKHDDNYDVISASGT